MAYADPGYQADGEKRYPLDSERHIRAAWAFIHEASNAARYGADELQQIKARIVAAWREQVDPNGPPTAMPTRAKASLAGQAALDHLHDGLAALTDGACCQAQPERMHRHLKTAHDALCRAGASCDSFVDAGNAENDADKAARAGELTKAADILSRLDALAKRMAELEATPLPPLTVARAAGGVSKRDDAGHPGVSAEDVVAALAGMSDDERTLALIKAAHHNPIRPFR